jgi:hypothetical protein
MLAHGSSNWLHFFKRSFTRIHFQQRLEVLESLHRALPGIFWYGKQIGSPGNTFARNPIWRSSGFNTVLPSRFGVNRKCRLALSLMQAVEQIAAPEQYRREAAVPCCRALPLESSAGRQIP